MKNQKIIKSQGGISLVEVLVSLVVTGVGLLGVAAIQSISIKMSYDSYLRSQATFLYYDLADRMRANPEADYTLLSSTSYSTAPSPTCGAASSNCSSDQLKDHDLYYWWVAANELLPNANLTVEPPTGGAQLTNIVIEWGNQVEPSTTTITDGDDVVEVVVRQRLDFQVEI
jgi:type IV pilus assembly protein PilV